MSSLFNALQNAGLVSSSNCWEIENLGKLKSSQNAAQILNSLHMASFTMAKKYRETFVKDFFAPGTPESLLDESFEISEVMIPAYEWYNGVVYGMKTVPAMKRFYADGEFVTIDAEDLARIVQIQKNSGVKLELSWDRTSIGAIQHFHYIKIRCATFA